MKLFFDENLAERLVTDLRDLYPDSSHVRMADLGGGTDRNILDLAGRRLELQDLLNREVDIATPNSLHPKLRARILAHVIPLP